MFKSGQVQLGQVKSGQDRSSQDRSSQDSSSQNLYLELECGPAQSYLFLTFVTLVSYFGMTIILYQHSYLISAQNMKKWIGYLGKYMTDFQIKFV